VSGNKRLGDCFHDGEYVLEAVADMHRGIPSTIRPSDHVTAHVLERIDSDMLSVSGSRLTAHLLWVRLDRIIDQAKRKIASRSNDGSDERGSGLHQRYTLSPQPSPMAGPSRYSLSPVTLQSPFRTPAIENHRHSQGTVVNARNYTQYHGYTRTSSPELNGSTGNRDHGKFRDLRDLSPERPATRPQEARRSPLPSVRQASGASDQYSTASKNGFHQHLDVRDEHQPFGRLSEERDENSNVAYRNTVHSLETSPFRQNSNGYAGDINALRILDNPPSGNGHQGTLSNNLPIHQIVSPGHSNQETRQVEVSSSPSNSTNQVRRRRQHDKLPHLSIGTAMQWRMQQKSISHNIMNKFMKREPKHKLPGHWLFKRLEARDHVSLQCLHYVPSNSNQIRRFLSSMILCIWDHTGTRCVRCLLF
jgi:hypothetical protein